MSKEEQDPKIEQETNERDSKCKINNIFIHELIIL